MAVDVYGGPARRPGVTQHAAAFVSGLIRLILPSIMLSAIYIVSFYLVQTPSGIAFETTNTLANPAWWMTAGHLSLCLAFFAVVLTNRRSGPGMAFGQVLMSWATIAVLLGLAANEYGLGTIREELFPTMTMIGFVSALLVAHIAAILAFDKTRGVPWWRAPLAAGIIAPLVFVLIFYPIGHWGADAPWTAWMGIDFVAKAMLGIVLVVPYGWLRGMVRPGPGLGGA